MEIKNLKKILNGEIDLIDQVNIKDIALLNDSVHIKPQHVRKMLIKFLKNKINPDDLKNWATFICLRGEYVPVPIMITPDSQEFDEIADYYEDMMYIVQRLSTPEIDGDITKERVKGYLKELDKYKHDKYAHYYRKPNEKTGFFKS